MTKNKEVFKWNFANQSIYFLGLLAFVSGVLVGTSYIPHPAWALSFCYIPLWWAILKAEAHGKSYKFIFILGWITQFTLTLIGFNWIYFTAREFGHLPVILSFATVVLFAAFVHLYIPFALVCATYLKRKFNVHQTGFIFTVAISHILFERFWPSIFEWNLGYMFLWMKWPLAQWADTIGFWGLSALIFIFQAIVLYCFLNLTKQKKKSLIVIAALVFCTTAFWITGLAKQKKYQNLDSNFNVSLIQANISNEEKLQSEKGYDFQPYVINSYFDETEKALIDSATNKPDLIIWPETALPIALDQTFHDRPNQKSVLDKLKFWQTNLVTGAYSQDLHKHDHLGSPLIRNSVFFLNQGGEITSPYFKTDLLVFGEYMPLGEELPFLYKLLPFVGVYERGPGPVRKEIPIKENEKLILGPQICYESLNPGFSRGLAKIGTQVFFNLTNDSWFGSWAEPYQHMTMTLARGLENRRPLIRATNTGISTVILASGEELERSPVYRKWSHTFNVNYQKNPELTFYTQYGYMDWVLWMFLLLLILWKGQNVSHKKS